MKIVNDEQEEQLKRMLQELDEVASLPFPAGTDLPRRTAHDLRRSLNQFHSNIMVIVALGMLKAGKSTLINLLARSDKASPVGFGRDTTLRPVLVRMAKEGDNDGNIVVYYRRKGDNINDDTANERALADIMDYIRGLGDPEKLNKSEKPLTQENLQRILCCSVEDSNNLLTSEPVLVVVTTPYSPDCKLLSDGRMLLDMPGLDSATADVSRLPQKYEVLVRECDLMFCVQSSVAPLNEKACSILSDLLKIRDSATTWIVQNMMLSKHWLKENILREEQESQTRHAMKTIKQLQERSPRDIKKSFVNLGMAYDSILGDEQSINPESRMPDGSPATRENLLKESRFMQLEEELLNDLEQNGSANRFQHCKDELIHKISSFKEEAKSELKKSKEKEAEAYKKRQQWRDMDAAFRNALSNYTFHNQSDCSIDQPLDFAAVIGELKNAEYQDLKGNIQLPGSRIDAYFKACSQKLFDACCRFLKDTSIQAIRFSGNHNGNGIDVCNMEIKACFDEQMKQRDITSCTYSECYSHIGSEFWPSCTLNAEENLLDLDVHGIGGFNRPEPSRQFTVYESLTILGIPIPGLKKEKKWEPQGEPVRKCEENLKEAYLNALRDYVNKHIAERFQDIIKEKLQTGSERFRSKISEEKSKQEENYEQAQHHAESAKRLIEHLDNLSQIAHEL